MNMYVQKEMFCHSWYYFIAITQQEIEVEVKCIVLWDSVPHYVLCYMLLILAIAVGHLGFQCTQKIYDTLGTKSSIPKTHPGLGGYVRYVHCCDVFVFCQ